MRRGRDTPLPLYHQIYTVIREQIVDGTLPEGGHLPGEMALASTYNVSRVTIRATLRRLESEGLICRQRGRGTFVNRLSQPKPAPADLRGFLDNLVEFNSRTKVRIVAFQYMAAPQPIARMLDLPIQSTVQHVERVSSHGEGVFAYMQTYVREEVGRTFTKADLRASPMLPLIQRAGIEVSRAEQTVTAKLADGRAAELLEVAVGSALIQVSRTIYDQFGTPVEVNQGLYRPDRYEFRLVIEGPAPSKEL